MLWNIARSMQRGPMAVGLMALVASGCATSGAMGGGGGGGGDLSPVTTVTEAQADAARGAPLNPLATTPREFLRNAQGIYVVVDLDTNLLRLMDGSRKLWEAPVGTGTGLRLESDDNEWHFTTPRGVFQIQFKEEVPIWIRPDWWYVQRNLHIPPREAPERRLANQLGIAAVYIGEEIAIHGTERPELLGQRVSHGCIRLHNDFALRLFHNVQIGTPVVIMGGEHLDNLPPPPPTEPGRNAPPAPDPLAGVSTDELLRRLDRALAAPTPGSDWVRVTSRLITRGLKDDAPALRGLLERAGTARNEQLNLEYATFLADAYSRGSLRAIVSLARIEPAARTRAARAIVSATIALHPGGAADPRAPWPTSRVPTTALGPEGRAGWELLATAEREYRTRASSVASGGNR